MNKTVVAFCLTFVFIVSAFAQPNASPPVIIRRDPGLPPSPVLPTAASAPGQLTALAWDSTNKTYHAKPGEISAPFVFNLTNTSSSEVIINAVNTSCGCTLAELPPIPWHVAPGASGQIKAAMNFAGKMGLLTKQVNVVSSAGTIALLVSVNIPPAAPPTAENLRGDRNANLVLAQADRQAVFKGDCATCHVDNGVGKMGHDLFVADCAICHDTPHRAAMVPDLRAPKGPRDYNYWSSWISHGRIGSLMPGFAASEGGPLSKEQIDSLAIYLLQNFPQGPVVIPVPATPEKTGGGQ